MAKSRKSRSRKKPSLPDIPLGGDHGTGTARARANTVMEPMLNEKGENPNGMGRVRRIEVFETLTLTMRQQQAAKALRDAYCRVDALSSGSPLKVKVDTSARPDAATAHQVDTMSRLINILKGVPSGMEYIVDHVCRKNLPINQLGPSAPHSGVFKRAMDAVADHLRY